MLDLESVCECILVVKVQLAARTVFKNNWTYSILVTFLLETKQTSILHIQAYFLYYKIPVNAYKKFLGDKN